MKTKDKSQKEKIILIDILVAVFAFLLFILITFVITTLFLHISSIFLLYLRHCGGGGKVYRLLYF